MEHKLQIGEIFGRNVLISIVMLLILSACGDPNGYNARAFPDEGKKAFEEYLDKYATKYEDTLGMKDSGLAYIIQWAPKGREYKTDITGAWCLLTTEMVWFDNKAEAFFVVYQTNANKWLVNASEFDYKKVGCGV